MVSLFRPLWRLCRHQRLTNVPGFEKLVLNMCKIGFKYVQIKFIQRDKFQSLSTLLPKNQPIRIVLEIGATSFHQSAVIPWPVSSSPPPPVYGGSLVGTSAILGHCRAPNIHAKMVGVYHLILPRLWRRHACDVSNTTKILPFLSLKKIVPNMSKSPQNISKHLCIFWARLSNHGTARSPYPELCVPFWLYHCVGTRPPRGGTAFLRKFWCRHFVRHCWAKLMLRVSAQDHQCHVVSNCL